LGKCKASSKWKLYLVWGICCTRYVCDRISSESDEVDTYIQDNPTRLAEILVEFWKRNEKVIAGIKKVGDL